jgi:proteic killer suppression protein
VQIRFRTTKLQKQYENHREAEKAYGIQVARKYIERINIIKQSHGMDELRRLPGLSCHELKADRHGQWAVNLTMRYRLIFFLEGDEMEIVCIQEVSKHYND